MPHTVIQSVEVFLDGKGPAWYNGVMDELIDEATEMIFDFMDDNSIGDQDEFRRLLAARLLDTAPHEGV